MRVAYVDGRRLRQALIAAERIIVAERVALNRINVFPVPDGDTGSNLAITLRSIIDRIRGGGERRIFRVARDAADAAVIGGRGNSGMLLAQFLLGFADALDGRERVGGAELVAAIRGGSERLERAMEAPAEGTMVTVARDVARAGEMVVVRDRNFSSPREADPEDAGHTAIDILDLLVCLVAEARVSLERTPDLLPVLRRAGVVDAGARGFVLLLEGTLGVIEGMVPGASGQDGIGRVPGVRSVHPDHAPATEPMEPVAASGRFCTEALVRGENLPDEATIRHRLRGKGDSLIASRTGNALKVHIHTDDPGEVFALLEACGRLVTRKAEDLRAQSAMASRAFAGEASLVRRPLGIVTDTACDLPDDVLRAHGIRLVPLEIVSGDRTFRDREELSAEEFHEALRTGSADFTTSQPSVGAFLETFGEAALDAEALIVLTLGSTLSGTIRSAEAARAMFDGAEVRVVDSRGISVLQGLLALKAAELAEAGASPEDVVRKLEWVRPRSGILLAVDRFDRLRASGRVGPGVARVGTGLGLKPILFVAPDGRVVRATQAFGRKRVLRALMKALGERLPSDVARFRFGVAHVGAPDRAAEVVSEIESLWEVRVELPGVPASPAIANHVGIGAIAIAFIPEDRPGS